jgi:hypothetical protein
VEHSTPAGRYWHWLIVAGVALLPIAIFAVLALASAAQAGPAGGCGGG